ncbi:MAG: hypothetical protein PF572_01640 [Patescibacteria group bacterium]|jgi:hypothetical protein|nr:hypothetical protein [Patescibacteria group bacterium]
MKNKEKILIALASFSFFLIVYLVIASKEIEMPNEKVVKEEIKIEKVDLAMLESTYQEKVRGIYFQLKDDANLVASSTEEINVDEKLTGIKNSLMSLVVPDEYRAFHLSLVVTIDRIIENNFILDSDFQLEIEKIGQDNLWLN